MKIKIDIDCTPGEARSFFGLPDMEPLQTEAMARMREHMANMDPGDLMKLWMPVGTEALQRMQEAFMAGFSGTTRNKDPK